MNRFGVIAVLLLAACSSGGDSSPQEPSALYDELEQAELCDNFAADTDTELFVREQGTCEAGEGWLTIYTFSGNGQDQWLEAAEEFGGGPMVVGDRWVVVAQSQPQAEDVAQTLGGDVR